MKSNQPTFRAFTALTLLTAALSLTTAQAQTPDLYAGLKTYDFQNRAPVFAVWQAIRANPKAGDRDAIETGLIGVLQDPAATVAGKQEACRMLWEIGTKRSVPALAALLPDEKLSDAARFALERNPDKSAKSALRDALKTATGLPLIGLLNSLGDQGDMEDVAAIHALTSNTDPDVARAATRAQTKIFDKHKVAVINPPAFTGDERADVVAAAMMTRRGSSASLADALNKYPTLTPPVQTALIAGFGARGYHDAAPLVDSALVSPDPALRLAAIQSAGAIEGAKAVPALTKLAATGDGRDKREARLALSQMPGKEADSAILTLSRSSADPLERAALLDVLANRRSPAYHASLLDAARGTDEKVAVSAIKSFAQAGTPGDEPALVAIETSTTSEAVRETAGDALASIGQRSADHNGAAQPLIDALPTASAAARPALISALAQIGGDKAIAAVGTAAASSDTEVKSAAVTGLAETTNDPAALPILWNLAKTDTDRGTRVQALRGYVRVLALTEKMPVGEKVGHLKDAIALAERPEEKKAALGVLRSCRTPAALELAAANLDDPAVFNEAADAVLALAAPHRAGNRMEPAIKGPATTAALAKIATLSTDDAVKAKATALQSAK